MPNWIKTIAQDDLPEGTKRMVRVHEQDVLLVHHQGQIHAVRNTCPHMGASLEKGTISKDGAIVCPRHHSAFDLRTGDVKDWAPWPPGVGLVLGVISREKALPVYATRVEEGAIWVALER